MEHHVPWDHVLYMHRKIYKSEREWVEGERREWWPRVLGLHLDYIEVYDNCIRMRAIFRGIRNGE